MFGCDEPGLSRRSRTRTAARPAVRSRAPPLKNVPARAFVIADEAAAGDQDEAAEQGADG